MELVVDLERVTVVLADAHVADRLVVRVGAPAPASAQSDGDVHRLHDVLVAANVGRLVDAATALVLGDAVRFHAAGQVDDGWPARFAALCRRQSPGRAPADGEWLEGPVEWPRDAATRTRPTPAGDRSGAPRAEPGQLPPDAARRGMIGEA